MSELRFAFFLGKSGGDYIAVQKAAQAGLVNIKTEYVFSSSAKSEALAFYKDIGGSNYLVAKNMKNPKDREIFFRSCLCILQDLKIDYIFLSGFKYLLPAFLVSCYQNKIINSHHSLLPAKPGLYTKEELVSSDDKFLGATLHFVDNDVDTGTKLSQAVFPNLGPEYFNKILKTFRFVQNLMVVQLVRDLTIKRSNIGFTCRDNILFNPSVEESVWKLFKNSL